MSDLKWREAELARQQQGWELCLKEAKRGNPFATLCYHCYGRHAPPRDDLCPNEPPKRKQP